MWINSRGTLFGMVCKLGNRIEGCRVRDRSVEIATSAKVIEHPAWLSGMVRTSAVAPAVAFGQ
jgi:hypothetical protein